MDSIKKYLYIIVGSVSLILGIVGVFLPVLPTTPFLLLSSFCYVRSSQRMYHWLINHKIFGAYIYNYLTYKAIPKKTKVGAILFLWTTLIISMIIVKYLHIRLFLIVVGLAVSTHLLMLKTLNKEDLKRLDGLYFNKNKESALSEKE
ncbi:MAG: YbaN family protein [Eubacteriales bacterium]|nr:YbaN family protein [Eubacteriales bacterium]MDD3349958.1 YbaN family protein [Eubacteriales bacterium]